MQLNYSENNSFAEYATVSAAYFDAGRQKEKAILVKVQAFLWGLAIVEETRAPCGISEVKSILLVRLGYAHTYLNRKL